MSWSEILRAFATNSHRNMTSPTQRSLLFSLALSFACALSSLQSVNAADVKVYQVTGPVLEVTPTSITVQKGDDKWQIARDKHSKVPADVKVGSKVTIYYQMIATEVEVKDAKTKK